MILYYNIYLLYYIIVYYIFYTYIYIFYIYIYCIILYDIVLYDIFLIEIDYKPCSSETQHEQNKTMGMLPSSRSLEASTPRWQLGIDSLFDR